jgi:hypothetical protein
VNFEPSLFFSLLPPSLFLPASLSGKPSPSSPRFASYLLAEGGSFTTDSVPLAATALIKYKFQYVDEDRSAASPPAVWTMDATGPKEVGRRIPRKTV